MFFRGTNQDRIASRLWHLGFITSWIHPRLVPRFNVNFLIINFEFNRTSICRSSRIYFIIHLSQGFTRAIFFASLESLFRDATWEKRNFSRTRNNVACNALRTATPICAVVYCVNEWLTCRCLRRPHLCYHMTDVMSRCARDGEPVTEHDRDFQLSYTLTLLSFAM